MNMHTCTDTCTHSNQVWNQKTMTGIHTRSLTGCIYSCTTMEEDAVDMGSLTDIYVLMHIHILTKVWDTWVHRWAHICALLCHGTGADVGSQVAIHTYMYQCMYTL